MIKETLHNKCTDRNIPVRDAANGALAKLHHVSSESACLVGENILDLAQVFIQVGGTRLQSSIK